jgi:hypothetical protein
VGSSMSSQPLADDDTATLTPRHPPRGLLSLSPTIAYHCAYELELF